MASLRLPFSQHASNVDLGIVCIVWLEILELLADGYMLCSRQVRVDGRFRNPRLDFSLRETFNV